MSDKPKVDIARIFAEVTPIEEALEEAARAAAIQHKRAGLPLVVWKNGKVAYIPAEAINDDGTVRDEDEPDEDDEPDR
ncbi:hypothetical protein [Paludisphaera borealis]|uniref:Uncharacterized protein n=1 Tax=Paludisphaera borealis TaxID=1387353 RepID=A0A1U7CJZ4_9BACT|nr:hypothetical protein [Paludisphaera borealis]APW59249.1 hypothetical protein BSF38_00665 [Paludisphaera borealis]